jgi:hypothetical protein
MSAPRFVPTSPLSPVRAYESPPRRPGGWRAERPGDLGGEGQPEGELLGSPGPDQGFAWKLVGRFADRVHLREGESPADVHAGCVAVALKRAGHFRRAPVVHDLTIAYTLFGFLDLEPPEDLVDARRHLFAGVGHPHHYTQLRAVADAVPLSTLAGSPESVATEHRRDWRRLVRLGPDAGH